MILRLLWIVAGERLTPAQAKFAYCVVMMAGSGLKSAKGEKGYIVTSMH
jgi:hypothetical protein